MVVIFLPPCSVVTPDMVDLMIEKASLMIVERSNWLDTGNTYLSRDYFVVVQKAPACSSDSTSSAAA